MPFFCYVLGNDMMSCSIWLKFKDDKLYELVGFFAVFNKFTCAYQQGARKLGRKTQNLCLGKFEISSQLFVAIFLQVLLTSHVRVKKLYRADQNTENFNSNLEVAALKLNKKVPLRFSPLCVTKQLIPLIYYDSPITKLSVKRNSKQSFCIALIKVHPVIENFGEISFEFHYVVNALSPGDFVIAMSTNLFISF